jgi:ribulose-phosphate 3-epimerase
MEFSLRDIRIPAIAPSILTADFGSLRRDVEAAEHAGIQMIHLDVMDGHFVPNISFGPLVVAAVRECTGLPLDVHLMITDPERYVDAFVDAGSDIVTIHAEATPHVHRAVQQIRDRGCHAGVAINPGTSLGAIEELIDLVDLVLVMTVNPGFGGQAFLPEMVGKVERLRTMIDSRGSATRIEVDGGIKPETIAEARNAGAELFVCGSSIFNERQTVAEAMQELSAALA